MENKNKNMPSLDDKMLRLPETPPGGELPEDEDKSSKKKRKRLLLLLLLLLLVTGGTFGGLLWLKANGNQGPSDAAAGNSEVSVEQDDEEPSDDLGMIICEVLDGGALNCTMDNGGDKIILNGYIICIKESDGKIRCSNGRGETIQADCLATVDGRFDCTDSSGNKLENILSCTPLGDDKLSCVTADGDLIEITINKEVVREVVKEVEKEVVKEVQKEVVVVVDKTPPKVLKTNRSTSAPTNGDVTVVLEFDKPVTPPAGWVHDGATNKIKKVFTENVDTDVKVCDTNGNCDTVRVIVGNIDKIAPSCNSTTQGNPSIYSGLYEYLIACNEAVKIEGWNNYSDTAWTKGSTASLAGASVVVTDLAGNKSTVVLK